MDKQKDVDAIAELLKEARYHDAASDRRKDMAAKLASNLGVGSFLNSAESVVVQVRSANFGMLFPSVIDLDEIREPFSKQP